VYIYTVELQLLARTCTLPHWPWALSHT